MLVTPHLVGYWPFEGNARDVTVLSSLSDKTLVGYWPLNETSGTNAPDESGNGNDGTLVNMEDADWVDGVSGKCLSFDGVNEYVDCGNDTSLDITDAITVSAWYYSYNRDNWETILCKGANYPNDIYNLGYESTTNTVTFILNFVSAGRQSINYIKNLEDGFHHVAGTYDGTTMRLYIDGVEVNFDNYTDTIKTDNNPLQIGMRSSSYIPAKGLIDEVRIYNTALTADEIKVLYAFPAGGNHGTVHGASLTTGKFGKCYSFDGVDDYIQLPNISISEAMTYSAWVKTDNNALVRQYILTLQVDPPTVANYTYQQRQGFMLSNNDVQVQYWTGGDTVALLSWEDSILNDIWYFITVVVDASGGKLYVNGDLKDSNGTAPVLPTPNECLIGARNDAQGTNLFDGLIDQVQIYNKALSQSDIKKIMLGFHPLNG